MKLYKKIPAMLLAFSLAAALTACGGSDSSAAGSNSAGNSTSAANEANTAEVLTDPAGSGQEASGDFSVTPGETGSVVTVNGSTYTITAAGEYTVTGSLEDGQILVDAGDEDEVVIILNNASISSSVSAPIQVENAGEVTVKSEEGSYNVINDTRTLTAAASDDEDEEDSDDPNAAIWSDCDLKITGKGTLIVTSTYDNGIKSEDDLKIKNVTLKVTAPGVALKGNDTLTVESGSIIAISTGADGVKTSNSDVSDKGNQRGVITISGGQLDIYAAGDGVSAAYSVIICEGEGTTPVINIMTGSNSEYTTASASSAKGIKSDNLIEVSAGTVTISAADDAIHANAAVELENGETSTGSITVKGGSITVTSGDDGMHADGYLTISGGAVNIANSHEGLEANVIIVSGGTTYVYGDDDGVNATSGATTPLVNVTGGYLEVATPAGDTDAIDSNGNVTISGGFVLVKAGAQGGMAGSVDVDGSITVSGGTVVAFGGICELPSGNSVNTYATSGTSFSAGSYTVADGSGNTLFTFELDSTCSSLWMSSELFEQGSSYSLEKDGSQVLSWTQSSSVEGSYNATPGGFGPMGGGMDGQRGGFGQQGGFGGRR